jgi:hypothetical protein
LGVGIGAATFDPFYGTSPDAATFSLAAFAWWAISGIISAFFGGWVAGALVGQWWRFDGAVHGFIAWCISTLMVAFVIAGAAGGTAGVMSNLAGPLASQFAADNPREANRIADMTTEQFTTLLQSTTGDSPTQMAQVRPTPSVAPTDDQTAPAPTTPDRTAGNEMETALDEPTTGQTPAGQTTTPMTQGPAQTAQPTYQQPTTATPVRTAQSRAAAERMADAIAQGAIWSFIALVLGALAAVGGGYMATSNREEAVVTTTTRPSV